MSLPWQLSPTGLVVEVQVQPRTSRNRLLGWHGQCLKIALSAPLVDGAANAALIAFVAALVDLPPRTVSLHSGAKSRAKRVHIQTATPAHIGHRLQVWLARLDNKSGMISVAHSCLIFERRTTRHADL